MTQVQFPMPVSRWFHRLPVLRGIHERDMLIAHLTVSLLGANETIKDLALTVVAYRKMTGLEPPCLTETPSTTTPAPSRAR